MSKEQFHEEIFNRSHSRFRVRLPALAEQFYVVFDPASHKCEAMHEIPKGMKSMGTYGSMDEAKRAMGSMKECG